MLRACAARASNVGDLEFTRGVLAFTKGSFSCMAIATGAFAFAIGGMPIPRGECSSTAPAWLVSASGRSTKLL
jgi:hypothetical protein